MRRAPKHFFAALSTASLVALAMFGGTSAAFAGATVDPTVTTPQNQFNAHEDTTLSPDGTTLAVAAYYENQITLISQDSPPDFFTITDARIKGPVGMVYSHDGSTLYVANYDDPSVVIIDVATRTVTGTFPTRNTNNIGIALSPDGSTLVVSDGNFVVVTEDGVDTNVPEDNITAYTVGNGFPQGNTGTLLGGYTIDLFFVDNTTVLGASTGGVLEKFNLGSGAVTPFATLDANGYWCANSDLSLLATAKNDGDGEPDRVILVDRVTGDDLSTLVVPDTVTLAHCAFTNKGQLIWTDFDYNTEGDGQVFALGVQNGQMSFLQRFMIPDVEYTTGVGIMANCKVLIPGYYTNLGVLTLDSEWCSVTASGGSGGGNTLANTGSAVALTSSLAAFAALLVVTGAAAFAMRSRVRSQG